MSIYEGCTEISTVISVIHSSRRAKLHFYSVLASFSKTWPRSTCWCKIIIGLFQCAKQCTHEDCSSAMQRSCHMELLCTQGVIRCCPQSVNNVVTTVLLMMPDRQLDPDN